MEGAALEAATRRAVEGAGDAAGAGDRLLLYVLAGKKLRRLKFDARSTAASAGRVLIPRAESQPLVLSLFRDNQKTL